MRCCITTAWLYYFLCANSANKLSAQSKMDAKSERSNLEEKERLLDYESRDEEEPVIPPSAPYGTTQVPAEGNHFRFLYHNRERIPGYGVYMMVRQVRVYALYVLLMMLIAYLLNQLDRYTLPIVTKSVGYDLKYGDLVCMETHNETVLDLLKANDIPKNVTDMCSSGKPENIK